MERGKAAGGCAFPLSARGRQGDNGGVSFEDQSRSPSVSTEMLAELTSALKAGELLGGSKAEIAAYALAHKDIPVEVKAEFLKAFSLKGETPDEIVAFAKVFRALARNPNVEKWASEAVDVCGTGGDHSGSYNISTTVAFIMAAAEVPVLKHGNRSITSKSGSADFLLASGIPLTATDAVWQMALDELSFAFFFAPNYHPAFEYVAPVRKTLGVRTIFNVLGPLLNPGKPAFQLIGVSSYEPPFLQPLATPVGPLPPYLPKYARAVHELGLRRGLIVHGRLSECFGLDELSVVGKNYSVGVGEWWNGETENEITVDSAGLTSGKVEDLKGGDADENLKLLNALLDDKAPAGLRDTILLNAGAALWIVGRTDSLKVGVREARRLLTSGPVREWLKRTREFFQDHKI